jgi:hypothetical protein
VRNEASAYNSAERFSVPRPYSGQEQASQLTSYLGGASVLGGCAFDAASGFCGAAAYNLGLTSLRPDAAICAPRFQERVHKNLHSAHYILDNVDPADLSRRRSGRSFQICRSILTRSSTPKLATALRGTTKFSSYRKGTSVPKLCLGMM